MTNRLLWTSILLLSVIFPAFADTPLRRPISPERPMWIVHIDTWNTPDPERIIEMVPEDIRPYCVFNLSLSATDAVCCNGYDVCDSWLKACAQKRVWSMVQCASGSHSRFSDHDLAVYEDYFRKYPNFIGWNFAEQFWGFGDTGQPSFLERLSLFGDILKICHRYGGYLVVSFTQSYYSADMMPIAYMKRNTEVNRLLTEHPEHFICCEKYTMSNGFYGIESECLGAWLGGYAGHYGIRFDACGWATADQDAEPFVKASGAIPIMEHVMLTGETVIDGPETIPVEVSREISTTKLSDGYTRRQWAWFPHFININIDEFRKILDGTVRILSRKEVIERSKICVQNDLRNQGSNDYLSPGTLFDGLYRPDCDHGRDKSSEGANAWLDNKWWLKSTGRYPAIPYLYDVLDDDAKTMKVVKVSEYSKYWPTVADKVNEFNTLFPQEYTGDIYAAHAENTWMTYNPYQYDDVTAGGTRTRHISTHRASGNIPFLYNTADSISIDFSPYSMAVMKEFPDKLTLYMTNYRNSKSGDKFIEADNATDIIKIYGATEKPQLTWHDRADHRASEVKKTYADGVLTIEVSHNGPVELSIKCSGKATGRLTQWTEAKIEVPELPQVYTGVLQYEAENFDYRNIRACRGNGYYHGHAGYQGQGFMDMGANSAAMIRDTVTVLREGEYNLTLRYQAPTAAGSLYITVNRKRYTVDCQQTGEVWTEVSLPVQLNAGENAVSIRYNGTPFSPYLDCIRIDGGEDEPYAYGMTVSQTSISDIAQVVGGVDVRMDTFVFSAYGMQGDVTLSADNEAFELSTDEKGVFAQTITVAGAIAKEPQTVYVRLKADAKIGEHLATVTISAQGLESRSVDVSGWVTPNEYTAAYDFEDDEATTAAQTPPAKGITVGSGNPCTAGVVTYTDKAQTVSNMLKIYSASGINGTGVLNLDRFTQKSTDYSVTWRQVVTPSLTYKNGILMRGDVNT
ncbi:MAG: hypothetical protein HUK08_08105, partial [Bacteroidaceae bacterium]|nr:hypothetical protein [Bacteroidaceae bacterium]